MKPTLILTSLLLAASAVFAEVKVATVDMAKLFDNYKRAKVVQTAIEGDIKKTADEAQRRQNEGLKMVQQLQDLRDKYANSALSQEARDTAKKQARTLEDQIEVKKNEFERFQSQSRQQLIEKQDSQRKKIYDEIQNAAVAVARQQGASLILNVSEKTAAGLPVVVYSDKSWDITDKVLSVLNAK